MAVEAPVNGVGTTLASSITSTATSLSLTSATGFTNAQYHVLLTDGTNYEIALATALSSTTMTVTRAVEAYNGVTTAFAFASGSTVTVVPTIQSVTNLVNVWGRTVFNVLSYGAKGDGTTDDTTAIQNCINACYAAGGGTVLFPIGVSGTYLISAPIVYRANISYEGGAYNMIPTTVIKTKNGSNLGAGAITAMFVPYNWNNSVGTADQSVRFYNLAFDGNAANNTGIADGIILQNIQPVIEGCQIKNTPGHCVHQTDVMKNGSNITGTAGQTSIKNNWFVTPVGDCYHQTCAAFNAGLDGFFVNNWVWTSNTSNWGFHADKIAGWDVSHNHFYGNYIGIIYGARAYGTHITNNYCENFGVQATASTYYNGFQITLSSGYGTVISDNIVMCSEPSTGVNGYTYYYVVNDSGASAPTDLVFANNMAVCTNATPTTKGTCFVIQAGTQTVTGSFVGNVNGGNVASTTKFTSTKFTTGIISTDTSGGATASSPAFVSGTALQLNTTSDTMLYVTTNTANSLAIAMGPTSAVATTLVATLTSPVGAGYSYRVPKGWYVKITGTIADFTIVAVTC